MGCTGDVLEERTAAEDSWWGSRGTRLTAGVLEERIAVEGSWWMSRGIGFTAGVLEVRTPRDRVILWAFTTSDCFSINHQCGWFMMGRERYFLWASARLPIYFWGAY